MIRNRHSFFILLIYIAGLGLISCSAGKELSKEGFRRADISAEEVVKAIPKSETKLQTVKGKGRAIVSEPGNTERVTLKFASDTSQSLVTIRNGIGIEGGKMLADGDSLLIYNKVDSYARKISVRSERLKSINRLASLNILRMLRYRVDEEQIGVVEENELLYRLNLSTGTKVYIDKTSGHIREVEQPAYSKLPYSKIKYRSYAAVDGFMLPRRISIFGADEKSKIALQLTSLNLNPKLPVLEIKLPDDIRMYNR